MTLHQSGPLGPMPISRIGAQRPGESLPPAIPVKTWGPPSGPLSTELVTRPIPAPPSPPLAYPLSFDEALGIGSETHRTFTLMADCYHATMTIFPARREATACVDMVDIHTGQNWRRNGPCKTIIDLMLHTYPSLLEARWRVSAS